MAAEFLLAFVFVVEEFRPENRGWGVALLGTHAILGARAAMILFGFIERIPRAAVSRSVGGWGLARWLGAFRWLHSG